MAYVGRMLSTKRFSRVLVFIPLALFALVAVTAAAPTNKQEPTISGEPRYRSELKCDPGEWNGAVSFDYRWVLIPGGFPQGTNKTYRVEAPAVDDELYCEVTATDAAGDTTDAISEPVTVKPAKYKLNVELSSPRSHTIRAEGRVTPRDAATGGSVVLYRPVGDNRFVQLDRKDLKPKGKFTLQYGDEKKGRRKYGVRFSIRGNVTNIYTGPEEIERRVKIEA